MANNTVNLNGFLTVEEIKTVRVNRNQETVSVIGWVDTAPAALGGHHPFVAIGTPAQVILDYARIVDCSATASPAQDTHFGITLRGKLISMPDRGYIEVKHISFFDLSHPLLEEMNPLTHFAANIVTLQGHLSFDANGLERVTVHGQPEEVLSAYLHTDSACAGGKHSVLVTENLNRHLRVRLTQQVCPDEAGFISAVVGGKLISIGQKIFIQAKYISLPAENHQPMNAIRQSGRSPF